MIGWKLAMTDPAANHKGVATKCGKGAAWFGWSSANRVGVASYRLVGKGTATLVYGNCWNAGKVNVYLNGKRIASAAPNHPDNKIVIPFTNGGLLELKDEGGNAVIKISSLVIKCDSKWLGR